MASEPTGSADEIELGYISGVFGVQGEVRLYLHNPDSDWLFEPRTVILVGPDGVRREVRLQARPGAGKRVLGRLHGVTDPDAAAAFMDWRLLARAADLPELDDDEFYYWQVEGLPVFVDGVQIGVVEAVHGTEGGEVLEIDVGDDTRFVPAIDRFVVAVDLDAGRIELAPDALDEP